MTKLRYKIIIKDTGEVIERFRNKATAKATLWTYKKTFVGCELIVIKIEDEDENKE